MMRQISTERRDAPGNASAREESRRTTGTRTENGDRPPGMGRQLLALGLNLVAPIALYYALRGAGVGIYPALIVGAVVPALGAVVTLIRREPLDVLGLFMMSMLLLSAGVALLSGGPRFLLAKDGWLTGVSGVWMLVSVRSRRPLTFLFARPLLEGVMARMAGAAGASWDGLWERVPRFRHIWRVVTVIWGIALLVDAVIRVTMAYTLPVDLVPGLGGALWPVTFVVLQVITNVYFQRAGFWLILRDAR
jgi:intracellular septation protein A